MKTSVVPAKALPEVFLFRLEVFDTELAGHGSSEHASEEKADSTYVLAQGAAGCVEITEPICGAVLLSATRSARQAGSLAALGMTTLAADDTAGGGVTPLAAGGPSS